MKKVMVFDSGFSPYGKSASLREDNKEVHPTHFKWIDLTSMDNPNCDTWFHTDWHTRNRKRGVDFPESKTNIAWLLEPRHLRPENYQYLEKNYKEFDVILTYDRDLILACPNATFYPFGGSSIRMDEWAWNYPKTKDVCMILSDKQTTEGHKLRHEIAKEFGDKIDLYGAGASKPFESTREVLKDYRYCIVVESGRADAYFTEKLIDPLSVGCVPVYWGCPTLWEFFPKDQMMIFTELSDIGYFFEVKDQYSDLSMNRKKLNWEAAKKYRCAEDWIWNNYPELFGREQK